MPTSTPRPSYFPDIPAVSYEGPATDNPFAFRWYDESRIVAGKSLKEHFRFACAYWHSFNATGSDPFGGPTHSFPWDEAKDPLDRARAKMDAAFEFITKMRIPYYCFHDVDVVDFTDDIRDNERRLQQMVSYAKDKQAETGVRLLWGTANLFSHKRYMNGAATNPDFHVLAHGAAQVKAALDATIELGGEGYVFWGGREGYMSLLNTDMKREKENLARFLQTARDYGRRNGFKGTFFIEPKPGEPSKHQYDYDVETVVGFLRQWDLLDDFKINIEVNHATLAGHTFTHELQAAADAGVLGSIDANRGDYQNGWDTDQFPNNLNELTEAMLIFLGEGGLNGGGVNFDAKIRRNSVDPADLFHAHIGGMDAFARALITADAILQKSEYRSFRAERYASYDTGAGKDFRDGRSTLEELRDFALQNGEPASRSGRQEWLENIINRYI
jgi:xylose isomerase